MSHLLIRTNKKFQIMTLQTSVLIHQSPMSQSLLRHKLTFPVVIIKLLYWKDVARTIWRIIRTVKFQLQLRQSINKKRWTTSTGTSITVLISCIRHTFHTKDLTTFTSTSDRLYTYLVTYHAFVFLTLDWLLYEVFCCQRWRFLHTTWLPYWWDYYYERGKPKNIDS